MQALNYLRRAVPGCYQSLTELACFTPKYAMKAHDVLSKCQAALKFVLPNNGRIFDDKLRGLPDDFRLPFNQVVIEYLCVNEGGVVAQAFGDEVTYSAKERIILAQQDEDDILVFSVICMHMPDGVARWYVQPFCAAISLAKNLDPAELAVAIGEAKGLAIFGGQAVDSFGTRYYDLGGGAKRAFGPDWEYHAYLDMMDEISAVLELIEALSCSNVSHEPLSVRKPNKSAEKRGALPFDEYHTLTVRSSVAGANGIPVVLPFDRRTPREHLRRGHIRRLQVGRRVWINSTVVNAGSAGVVSKSYRMAA